MARRVRSSRNSFRAGRRIIAGADARRGITLSAVWYGPSARGAGSVEHLKDEDEQVAAYQRGEYAEEAPLHHAQHASPGIIRKGMRLGIGASRCDQRMPVGGRLGRRSTDGCSLARTV